MKKIIGKRSSIRFGQRIVLNCSEAFSGMRFTFNSIDDNSSTQEKLNCKDSFCSTLADLKLEFRRKIELVVATVLETKKIWRPPKVYSTETLSVVTRTIRITLRSIESVLWSKRKRSCTTSEHGMYDNYINDRKVSTLLVVFESIS